VLSSLFLLLHYECLIVFSFNFVLMFFFFLKLFRFFSFSVFYELCSHSTHTWTTLRKSHTESLSCQIAFEDASMTYVLVPTVNCVINFSQYLFSLPSAWICESGLRNFNPFSSRDCLCIESVTANEIYFYFWRVEQME
jgi:hypothetical protein